MTCWFCAASPDQDLALLRQPRTVVWRFDWVVSDLRSDKRLVFFVGRRDKAMGLEAEERWERRKHYWEAHDTGPIAVLLGVNCLRSTGLIHYVAC